MIFLVHRTDLLDDHDGGFLQMRELSLEPGTLDEIASEVMNRGGSFSFRAHGSSMLPFVRDGAVLTIVPVDPTSVRRGDVVLHRSDHGLRAHRIVRRRHRGGSVVLYSRGDAFSGQAEQLSGGQILGKVVTVTYRGRTIAIGNRFWRFLGLVWVAAAPVSQIILRLAILVRNVVRRLARL